MSPEAAGTMGASIGGLVGIAAGQPAHMIGNAVNAGKDALAARQGLVPKESMGRRLKPGPRMAGGLVGAIMGGALGTGIRQQMINNSPEAAMLAKIQVNGVSPNDAYALQAMLEETYRQMGVA